MKALRSMIDSEFPVLPPDGVTVTVFYLDTPEAGHPWAAGEIAAIRTRYRLPAFVAPRGGLTAERGHADANIAAVQLRAHGIKGHKIRRRRIAVALDLELQIAPGYVAAFAAQLGAEGYATLPYGSLSTITANPRCAGYWAGQWNDVRHQAAVPGVVATQWTNNAARGWDLSVISPAVRLVDTGGGWYRRVLAELATIARQVRRRGNVPA